MENINNNTNKLFSTMRTGSSRVINILKNKYVFTILMFVLLFIFFFLNITQIDAGKYSLDKIFAVLRTPSSDYYINDMTGQIDPQFSMMTAGEFVSIQHGIWAAISTIVAAVGLSLAGLITQSLTRNPLADASTLGMTQAAIFGIIVALAFSFTSFYMKFIFALIGGVVASLLLILVISVSKGKSSVSKVVLTGLAIGIIFKTISFLVRKGDSFLNTVSFTYVLGGAEGVVEHGIGPNKWITLYIASGLISLGLIVTLIISRSMTLLELGDERAKNLGIKVKSTKIMSVFVIIVVVPSAVMLVGNIAFIGLFSVHISRYFTRSRDYRVLLLPAIVMSAAMSSLGLTLSNEIPSINSGLWMTFIGAPYLIYAGMRGLK